jgi:signal peptidase II
MHSRIDQPDTSEKAHSQGIRYARIAAGALGAALLIDQVTKNLAVSRLLSGPIDGPGPFQFRLVANKGALLGIPAPTWLLTLITIVVTAAAIAAIRKTSSRRAAAGYGLLVGGAFGNLVDRYQDRPQFPANAVVDWIDTASLPAFNLADVAILTGLILLAVQSRRSDTAAPSQDAKTVAP